MRISRRDWGRMWLAPPRFSVTEWPRSENPTASDRESDARNEANNIRRFKWLDSTCPDGEIGRRSGLKIRRPQGRGGSSPPLGTNIINDLDRNTHWGYRSVFESGSQFRNHLFL